MYLIICFVSSRHKLDEFLDGFGHVCLTTAGNRGF